MSADGYRELWIDDDFCPPWWRRWCEKHPERVSACEALVRGSGGEVGRQLLRQVPPALEIYKDIRFIALSDRRALIAGMAIRGMPRELLNTLTPEDPEYFPLLPPAKKAKRNSIPRKVTLSNLNTGSSHRSSRSCATCGSILDAGRRRYCSVSCQQAWLDRFGVGGYERTDGADWSSDDG